MLFSLNGTYIIFIVSFLIFMWLLNEIMLKPVGRVVEARQKLIEDNLEAGKRARGEAQQLVETYEQDLRKIRSEAQGIIQAATDEANRQRQAELDRVAREGQVKLEKAKEDIAGERAKLIDALVGEEAELVETITRKVLGDESVHVSIDETKVRRELEEAC
jgi:F-type H+-transporting ATPase subunit b